MFEEDSKCKFTLYLAFFITFLGYSGRYTGIEPINNQFFPFAVWSCILLTDNLSYRLKGGSLLISRTPELFFLAAWSLGLAGLSELLNLRLGAWHYLNQASSLPTRWTGRALTWAALLPFIFIMAELFQSLRIFRGLRSGTFKAGAGLIRTFFISGAALLLLSLAAPAVFWPLAVPAVFLLAEPLNFRLGLPSLLRELEGGLPEKTLRLAMAGLTCGLLWNWWNRASGSGWEYNLPGRLLSLKPAAAAIGFPSLGLSVYSLYSLASWFRSGKTWEEAAWTMPGRKPGRAAQLAAALFVIVTSYIALRAVDSHTVKMYLGWI